VQSARSASGARGEDVVASLNAQCLAAGIARVRKLPTPMRVVGRIDQRGQTRLLCVYSAKSGVDFVGVMLADGRAVAVEAKRCTDRRFPLARLEDHQRDELAAVHAAGGVAVVLVIHGPKRHAYALPWMLVARAVERGEKSLTVGAMEPYRVLAGTPYLRRWVRSAPAGAAAGTSSANTRGTFRQIGEDQTTRQPNSVTHANSAGANCAGVDT
jgi:recombination protein U